MERRVRAMNFMVDGEEEAWIPLKELDTVWWIPFL
jgi:hypothetical protein